MKKSATRPRPWSNRSARIRVVPGSNHSQSLKAGKFAAPWPTDPKFSAIKGLNPFKIVSKVQETCNILWVVFALSKSPHLHRAYLVASRLNCTPLYHAHDLEWKLVIWKRIFHFPVCSVLKEPRLLQGRVSGTRGALPVFLGGRATKSSQIFPSFDHYYRSSVTIMLLCTPSF